MGSALKTTKNFGMIDAIYVDWQYYISMFEYAISSQKFILNTKFEDKLDIVDCYITVKNMYGSGNLDEFIDFYINNKDIFNKVGNLI